MISEVAESGVNVTAPETSTSPVTLMVPLPLTVREAAVMELTETV